MALVRRKTIHIALLNIRQLLTLASDLMNSQIVFEMWESNLCGDLLSQNCLDASHKTAQISSTGEAPALLYVWCRDAMLLVEEAGVKLDFSKTLYDSDTPDGGEDLFLCIIKECLYTCLEGPPLVPSSSLRVLYRGGPAPWPLYLLWSVRNQNNPSIHHLLL